MCYHRHAILATCHAPAGEKCRHEGLTLRHNPALLDHSKESSSLTLSIHNEARGGYGIRHDSLIVPVGTQNLPLFIYAVLVYK